MESGSSSPEELQGIGQLGSTQPRTSRFFSTPLAICQSRGSPGSLRGCLQGRIP